MITMKDAVNIGKIVIKAYEDNLRFLSNEQNSGKIITQHDLEVRRGSTYQTLDYLYYSFPEKVRESFEYSFENYLKLINWR